MPEVKFIMTDNPIGVSVSDGQVIFDKKNFQLYVDGRGPYAVIRSHIGGRLAPLWTGSTSLEPSTTLGRSSISFNPYINDDWYKLYVMELRAPSKMSHTTGSTLLSYPQDLDRNSVYHHMIGFLDTYYHQIEYENDQTYSIHFYGFASCTSGNDPEYWSNDIEHVIEHYILSCTAESGHLATEPFSWFLREPFDVEVYNNNITTNHDASSISITGIYGLM